MIYKEAWRAASHWQLRRPEANHTYIQSYRIIISLVYRSCGVYHIIGLSKLLGLSFHIRPYHPPWTATTIFRWVGILAPITSFSPADLLWDIWKSEAQTKTSAASYRSESSYICLVLSHFWLDLGSLPFFVFPMWFLMFNMSDNTSSFSFKICTKFVWIPGL